MKNKVNPDGSMELDSKWGEIAQDGGQLPLDYQVKIQKFLR